MTVRTKVAMLAAEFLGTGILATSVINVARSQIGIGYFVAISVAATLVLLTMVFGSTSGAHFNPAVTIGMWTVRKIQTVQALAFIAAQMLGGLAAWRLAEYMIGDKLTSIAPKTFNWKVLVAEMVGTFVFTFGIAAAVYQRYENGRLAATIGMSLFVGTVVASIASNATLNPAIALANQSWSRAYIFGPIVGSLVGMNLYAYLFAPDRGLGSGSARVVSVPSKTVRPAAKKTTRKRK